MTQQLSKIKSIAEDLNIDENIAAMVIYDYLTYCLQELLIDNKTNTVFGTLTLSDNGRFKLENSKYGLIDLIKSKDIKLIRRIIEYGPDSKIFDA